MIQILKMSVPGIFKKKKKKKKISDRPGVLEKADPGDRKLTHF